MTELISRSEFEDICSIFRREHAKVWISYEALISRLLNMKNIDNLYLAQASSIFKYQKTKEYKNYILWLDPDNKFFLIKRYPKCD